MVMDVTCEEAPDNGRRLLWEAPLGRCLRVKARRFRRSVCCVSEVDNGQSIRMLDDLIESAQERIAHHESRAEGMKGEPLLIVQDLLRDLHSYLQLLEDTRRCLLGVRTPPWPP
jgi:hypothetical protein